MTEYEGTLALGICRLIINLAKIKHPGQSKNWYLDKVIYDLKRSSRFIGTKRSEKQ